MFSLLLIEQDTVKEPILKKTFQILINPAVKFSALTKICKTTRIVLRSYHNTGTNELRVNFHAKVQIAAENLFNGFKTELRSLCAAGFTSEIIAFRHHIESLLNIIGGGKNVKSIQPDLRAVIWFSQLEKIMRTISNSILLSVFTESSLSSC